MASPNTGPHRRSLPIYWVLGIAVALGFVIWSTLAMDDSEVNSDNVTSTTQNTSSNTTPTTNTATTPTGSNSTTSLPAKVLIAGTSFTSQAPNGGWEDPRQQDGCEEASILIAGSWATGQAIGTKSQALAKILELSKMADSMFGTFHDSSAADSLKLYRSYWKSSKGTVKYDITVDDLKRGLADGNVIIVPSDGRALNNPNFTGGGPERHMLVIIGYDDATGMFTTQDPGTRNGANYRYKYSVLLNSIRDYPTGDHAPIPANARKAMILIPKEA